jgi:hypothetical protein
LRLGATVREVTSQTSSSSPPSGSRRAAGRPRPPAPSTAEHARLGESPGDADPWRLWGPYVAGRQWGTVREDYSADGNAWDSFGFDQAHRRTYRWGEDGIAGICDRYGFLNLAVALWNGNDDRLKERYFGLTNDQGNHGEDAKEYWWHLDATPTHSWAQLLYRYPQAAYPYDELRNENGRRGRDQPEYELADTGVLDDDRFFDVLVTHAKASPDDICVSISATNHGPDPAPLDLVPQLWFRNTWRWGTDDRVPSLREAKPPDVAAHPASKVVEATHGFLGRYRLYAEGAPELLFCDNESNEVALWGGDHNRTPFPKDGVDRAIVHGDPTLTNPAMTGTKVGVRYHFDSVPPGETVTVRLRLCADVSVEEPFGEGFAAILEHRHGEADDFYRAVIPERASDEDRHVARRAFAGLLWGRQLYRYDVRAWLNGDPAGPTPPATRQRPEPAARNTSWRHLYLADVISMPDEWEYPWFAAWDLAFHCISLAHVDPAFAKEQLVLMCREWAQHPDGQIPAYEWSFSDVNPPVHAWAAWRVYVLDGAWDRDFLVRVFGKLLLNFSWWVNRKDADGSNLFEGGFLGMDNISVFDRSRDVPDGWRLEQSDATSWMAFFCLSMERIALELARHDEAWDDLATTFLERFLAIAEATTTFGRNNVALWNDADGFFYDVLVGPDQRSEQVPVRSLVGLLPLLGVAIAPAWVQSELHDFSERLDWLRRRRPKETRALVSGPSQDGSPHTTMSLLDAPRYRRLLERLFDEDEFLSPHGIRSLSAVYRDGQTVDVAGTSMWIRYDPAESTSGLFGGNSNWRGPVWMPVNALLVDALKTYAEGAGADLTLEVPTGSGRELSLAGAAAEVEHRLIGMFRPGADGRRPSDPSHNPTGPLWSEHPTFSEYFHGDAGTGLGASHQTGWTALVAHLICTTSGRPDAAPADSH